MASSVQNIPRAAGERVPLENRGTNTLRAACFGRMNIAGAAAAGPGLRPACAPAGLTLPARFQPTREETEDDHAWFRPLQIRRQAQRCAEGASGDARQGAGQIGGAE